MESRLESVEKRLEGMQTTIQEAIDQRMGEMMRIITERIEVAVRNGREGPEGAEGNPAGNGGGINGGEELRRDERVKRVEVPYFIGDDPYGWIFRVERYFEVHRIPEAEKVATAVVCLEGKALNWFQWWEPRVAVVTWLNFRQALLGRFQTSSSENPYEILMGLRQRGTVMEYREQFELLSAPLRFADEEFMRGVFMNGLREDIKVEVRLLSNGDLHTLMEVAQKVEERNRTLGRGRPNGYISRGYGPTLQKPALTNKGVGFSEGMGGTSGWMGQKSLPWSSGGRAEASNARNDQLEGRGNSNVSRRGSGFKKLTEEEENDKRRRGLCFRCDERYFPGHICRNKQLHVILLGEGEDEAEKEPETSELGEEVSLQLNVSSVAGMTSKNSLKLWGIINGRKVIVMVDSGASHNFLSHELVKELKIPIESTKDYFVEVGSGQRFGSQGVCKAVELQLPSLKIVQDFFLFDLVGVDVILGYEWLKGLGKFSADLGQHLLEIQDNGRLIEVKGDPSLSRTVASLKAVMKEMRNEAEAYYVELGMMNMIKAEESVQSEGIREILEEYKELFRESSELPPKRTCDHAIVLEEGSKIPNIRPYRYSHSHKEEIEKFVHDMLAAGLIRPSTSPYSSPLILVKKKDGSWRFCVDYRALNSITLPNKFPIPVIEELLDELGEAALFSKLDLKQGYHQIRMKEEDIHKTAFRTHEGHYEYLVMPFGLTNAPSTFQALMNEIFRPFLRKFVLVFFDDILVYSPDLNTHLSHLRMVFQTLKDHVLWVNLKKCSFAVEQLEYLGHIISAEGIKADPSKVEAMSRWPVPKDIKSLRGFLGLTGYYRRFVKDYGMMAKPLTQLLKKNNFHWSFEA